MSGARRKVDALVTSRHMPLFRLTSSLPLPAGCSCHSCSVPPVQLACTTAARAEVEAFSAATHSPLTTFVIVHEPSAFGASNHFWLSWPVLGYWISCVLLAVELSGSSITRPEFTLVAQYA